MKTLFEILFLEDAFEFLKEIEPRDSNKILYNIRKAQIEIDPELFKKLNEDIWEFRTRFRGLQYRLLAFWDNRLKNKTLVVATHGFIKKQQKVPDKEIQRAIQLRKKYFDAKETKK
jgi:phage-related protein